MIIAGRLNERITVERFVEADLPDGSVSKTWTTIHTAFCDAVEKDASIDTIATHDSMQQVVIFTMRYNPEIHYKFDDRILWRGRTLTLHSLKVDKQRTVTTIIAKTHNETTEM